MPYICLAARIACIGRAIRRPSCLGIPRGSCLGIVAQRAMTAEAKANVAPSGHAIRSGWSFIGVSRGKVDDPRAPQMAIRGKDKSAIAFRFSAIDKTMAKPRPEMKPNISPIPETSIGLSPASILSGSTISMIAPVAKNNKPYARPQLRPTPPIPQSLRMARQSLFVIFLPLYKFTMRQQRNQTK